MENNGNNNAKTTNRSVTKQTESVTNITENVTAITENDTNKLKTSNCRPQKFLFIARTRDEINNDEINNDKNNTDITHNNATNNNEMNNNDTHTGNNNDDHRPPVRTPPIVPEVIPPDIPWGDTRPLLADNDNETLRLYSQNVNGIFDRNGRGIDGAFHALHTLGASIFTFQETHGDKLNLHTNGIIRQSARKIWRDQYSFCSIATASSSSSPVTIFTKAGGVMMGITGNLYGRIRSKVEVRYIWTMVRLSPTRQGWQRTTKITASNDKAVKHATFTIYQLRIAWTSKRW